MNRRFSYTSLFFPFLSVYDLMQTEIVSDMYFSLVEGITE